MTELKNYILNKFENIYDAQNEKEQDFDEVLNNFIDSEMIYYDDRRKFFNLDAESCIKLWVMYHNGEITINSLDNDIIQEIGIDAFTCLCYDYLYSQLQAIKNKLDMEV